MQGTGNKIDSILPGFWVHPTQNTCYVLTQTVNGFTSSDTVCVNVQTVPLKFLSYELSLRGTKQSVLNEWTTVNEINVSCFNVQRSRDGYHFETIHKEQAKNKSNNEYTFIDDSPFDGWNYYRLESVDKDGKKEYSKVLSININKANGISIYPNPAKETLNIKSSNLKQIQVLDYLGRVVLQLDNPIELQTLNIQYLPNGLYIIKTLDNNGINSFEKFIKQ